MSKAKKKAASKAGKPAKVTVGQDAAPSLNDKLHDYMTGPVERLEHDFNLEHLTNERLHSAMEFVRACRKVGIWRLKQGDLTEDAGWFLGELAQELAHSIRVLIESEDVMLARRLPGVVGELKGAMQRYGLKMTGRAKKHHSIEQILKKHTARGLLAMLSALHPDWDDFLHIPNRQAIERMSEAKLRELLLSKVCWVGGREGERTEEWRNHQISEIIENIMAMRESEGPIINAFVEHLWKGRLWSLGPDKTGSNRGATFLDCPWRGKTDLPARGNVNAWMEVVMPFLKEVTGGDAMRLTVFEQMIAARGSVFAGNRLADDKPGYIWNQVQDRIKKAWATMTPRPRKRSSGKPA